jgi:hypothetical protein
VIRCQGTARHARQSSSGVSDCSVIAAAPTVRSDVLDAEDPLLEFQRQFASQFQAQVEITNEVIIVHCQTTGYHQKIPFSSTGLNFGHRAEEIALQYLITQFHSRFPECAPTATSRNGTVTLSNHDSSRWYEFTWVNFLSDACLPYDILIRAKPTNRTEPVEHFVEVKSTSSVSKRVVYLSKSQWSHAVDYPDTMHLLIVSNAGSYRPRCYFYERLFRCVCEKLLTPSSLEFGKD